MTRTRYSRSGPQELTESWDDMSGSYEDDSVTYDEDEERDEVGEDYKPRMNGSRTTQRDDSEEIPRRRTLRSSAEPEFIMPSSPNAAARANQRAATPHFRMNQRSLTSDAGEIRRTTRSSTPRLRASDRSMTGDAGRHRASKLQEHDEAEYESDEETTSNVSSVVENVARPVLGYVFDVLGLVLQNLKPILGYILLAWLLAGAFIFISGFVSNTINNALSPICRLPFTSNLAFCPSNRQEIQGNAEFDKLVEAQSAFQDVLANSAVGASLPSEMKRSEAGIRDLKHVVEHSSLPSKNELMFEFTGFIETARQASSDLSKFNSRIGRAVDHILSTNKWTLSVIEGFKDTEASHGAISRWVSDNLNIFAPFQPLDLSRDVLLNQYLRHTSAVEEQLQSLIQEAYAVRDVLDNLDGRLDVIAGIVTRDGVKVNADKDELFATLWTKLGGNRSTVTKLNQKLDLLNDVSRYRKLAWGHVTSTILQLQDIQNSLEDLRERVSLPETVGADKTPLEVHIESINLGIERLESQREKNRKSENERTARILGRAESGGPREIGGSNSEL